jgi:FAD/FMN-containing dehydrogenase/Fe-S oxidoreductase
MSSIVSIRDIQRVSGNGNGHGGDQHSGDQTARTPHFRPRSASPVDAKALKALLERTVEGEVRFDAGSRALYATDGSNYRQVPIGVVLPKSNEDVIATMVACRKFGAPVLSRGGGTSLAGQCCNVAVVMDFSKYMNKVLEIDPKRKLARVQPGCVLDDLRDAAEKHGLTFGPDPATHNHNTLGGMIGNDSCGVHSVMSAFYGEGPRTADNVAELDILLYDGTLMTVGKMSEREFEKAGGRDGREGQIYRDVKMLRDKYLTQIHERYPQIPRRVSGYNFEYLVPENFHLARALVGSEGTLVTVLEATVHLVESPPARTLIAVGYQDIATAGDHVPEVLKFRPTALEGVDDGLVEDMRAQGIHPKYADLLPEGKGWLLIEFGGKDKAESDAKGRAFMEAFGPTGKPVSMHLYDDPPSEEKLWEVRKSSLGATTKLPGQADTHPGWEDSAVPPDKVGAYLRDLQKLFAKYQYRAPVYGHLGQGCIHCRINFDLETHEGVEKFRKFMLEAARLVVSYGGSLSGEHGDGQARAELLPLMFGSEIVEGFREYKKIWDPDWKMNPGKVVDPDPIVSNFRTGPDYNPPQLKTHFKFMADHGSFAQAANRCVGVGECRSHEDKGVMCPSYRVTHEEMHSTRGRARLLFEMLEGNPLEGGWKNESVKEALDLCLACKGCKGDCPVHVDMATYKAEFLSHYYEGRVRPRSAYAFGLIPIWVKLAALAPGLLNLASSLPLVGQAMKFAAGMDQRRHVPQFAPQSFQAWFAQRPSKKKAGLDHQVILWPDTFNNSFHTETAKAAVEVLEHLGWEVSVPQQQMCCGRPLYDYGFMDMAKAWLAQILETLSPQIMDGVPVVVLEPSCAAVFRDELMNLFPADENAKRLHAQTFLLSEFIQRYAPKNDIPKLRKKAIVHGHCHHKSLMKMTEEVAILDKLGLDHSQPESGCCGMAGAFGFEQGEHFDVAMACGEAKLLPAIEKADDDTLIIADGFSCREQISQDTPRHALHLAQVLKMALDRGETSGKYPESRYITPPKPPMDTRSAIIIGTLALGVAAIVWRKKIRG